jgi:hypothetical protein
MKTKYKILCLIVLASLVSTVWNFCTRLSGLRRKNFTNIKKLLLPVAT